MTSATTPDWTKEFAAIAKQHQQIIRHKKQVALIDFFRQHRCPKPYYINDYLNAADKYGVDWRLLPALNMQESTCLERYPRDTNNPFGYGSSTGLYRFASIQAGIALITERLANSDAYTGKDLDEKLQAYGPHPDGKPSPTYHIEVMGWIKEISNE